jgi:hypothetical protein
MQNHMIRFSRADRSSRFFEQGLGPVVGEFVDLLIELPELHRAVCRAAAYGPWKKAARSTIALFDVIG